MTERETATGLRIGIDVSGARSPLTGIGQFTVGLVRALLENPGGHSFVLFSNAFRGDDEQMGLGLPVVNPRLPSRVLLGAWQRLHWPPIETFVGTVDVFHTSDWVHPPQRAGACVTTVHDLAPLVHPEWYASDVVEIHRRKNAAAAARATLIVADSQATRRDFLAFFPIDPERVMVVPAGVGSAWTRTPNDGPRTRQRYGLGESYLLFVGTREPRKNLVGLAEIFAQVAAQCPDLELAVVGMRPWAEGARVHGVARWTQSGFEQRCQELGMSGRVRVLGQVPAQDLAGLYAEAAAFVFPSLFEGFGIPVVEAMASGAPVVASDRTSIPEVAGAAALLADPEDVDTFARCVVRVVHDPALRADLRTKGRVQAAKFTWGAAATKMLDVYVHAAQLARGG